MSASVELSSLQEDQSQGQQENTPSSCGITMPVRSRRVSDMAVKVNGNDSRELNSSGVKTYQGIMENKNSTPPLDEDAEVTALATNVSPSPLTTRQMPPPPPNDLSKLSSDGINEQLEATIPIVGEDPPDCKHDCKGQPLPVQVLPKGVIIDCWKCLKNFNEQANLLLLLVQKTFEEMDVEKSMAAQAEMSRTVSQAGSGGVSPIDERVRAAPHKKPKAINQKKRINGRFAKSDPPHRIESGQHARKETRAAVARRQSSSAPQLELTTSTSSSTRDVILETGLIPSTETPINQNDGASVEESIHVKSLESVTPTAEAFPIPPNAVTLTSPADFGSQGSSDEIAASSAESFDSRSSLGATVPAIPALRERSTRKRKMSTRAREADESSMWGVSSDDGKLSRRMARAQSFPATSRDTTAETAVEAPPTKRPRSISQTSDEETSSPTRASQTPTPSTADNGTNTVINSNSNTPITIPQGSTIHVPSSSTNPLQASSNATKPGPARDADRKRRPGAKIPPSPQADRTLHSIVQKRPRGRPRKIRPDTSQVTPIAIQPKPTAETPNMPAAPPVLTYMPDYPIGPKRRGRPPKAKITLHRSPVLVPSASASAQTSTSTPGTSPEPSSVGVASGRATSFPPTTPYDIVPPMGGEGAAQTGNHATTTARGTPVLSALKLEKDLATSENDKTRANGADGAPNAARGTLETGSVIESAAPTITHSGGGWTAINTLAAPGGTPTPGPAKNSIIAGTDSASVVGPRKRGRPRKSLSTTPGTPTSPEQKQASTSTPQAAPTAETPISSSYMLAARSSSSPHTASLKPMDRGQRTLSSFFIKPPLTPKNPGPVPSPPEQVLKPLPTPHFPPTSPLPSSSMDATSTTTPAMGGTPSSATAAPITPQNFWHNHPAVVAAASESKKKRRGRKSKKPVLSAEYISDSDIDMDD